MRAIKNWFVRWMKGEIFEFISYLLLIFPIVIVAMLDLSYFPESELTFTYYYSVFHALLWLYLIVKHR